MQCELVDLRTSRRVAKDRDRLPSVRNHRITKRSPPRRAEKWKERDRDTMQRRDTLGRPTSWEEKESSFSSRNSGQNDIKKLRKENEQLRREIWSLRDEYDKLEDILKRQKSNDESEEDRSEEDDDLQTDFSEEDEEAYEEDDEKTEDFNQEEQLENAENQKISSEKMSSSLHRLHVEFDDLSVVDEEEEPKRDKERKEETTPSEEGQKNETGRHPPPPILGPRQLHDNIPFYPATYEPTSGFSGTSYYDECPYEFPSTLDLMLPTDTSALLASPCSGLQSDPLIPLPGLDAGLDQLADPMLPQIHLPPVGWQSDVLSQDRLPAYANVPSIASTTGMQMISLLENSVSSDPFSYSMRRRNARQPTRLQDASAFPDSRTQLSSSGERIDGSAWGIAANSTNGKNATINDKKNAQIENQNDEKVIVPEKPKHFFAPLSFKLKRHEEESPTASTSHFGTGTSSSSGKTASTVISRTNPFLEQKGSADIYVNGAIPYEHENAPRNKYDSKTSLSTNNLLIADSKNIANGQLMKSISCQNLSRESQSVKQPSLKLNHIESQMFTKSDNNLDSITNGSVNNKPYKSHLNVTLKIPRIEQAPSPETPEIPNFPSIDYRLFRNPFLRNFDKICPSYQAEPNPPATATPLSVQVNDDGLACQYPMSTYGRGIHRNEKLRATHLSNQNRLLIPSDQLISSKQDIQVTSFEKPSPCTLTPSTTPYDLATLRRLNTDRYLQNLYQNVPFVPRGSSQLYPQRGGMMYYDNVTKVTAQTQTSIDGDSHHEDERQNEETASASNSPSGQARKRIVKKDKNLIKDPGPLSPTAQRRLKKQISVVSTDTLDSPIKVARKQSRKLSATISDAQEDKNESRSSSSGQDSPRKEQNRRVSVHINSKRRSSQTSLKTSRSGSVADATKDRYTDGGAPHSERERTNSVSSRETASVKARKTSTSSGNVPWCACWGNGCI